MRQAVSCLACLLVASLVSSAAVAQDDGGLAGKCDPALPGLLDDKPDEASNLAAEKLQQDEENPYCHLAAGQGFLLQKNVFWAIRHLQRAVELLKNAEDAAGFQVARLMLCMALFDTGQWKDAVEACKVEQGASPGLAPLFEYHGGIAAFRADLPADAARLLLRAVDGGNASYLDSAAAFRDLAMGALIASQPGVKVGLGGGVYYDTNALMTPGDPLEFGISGDRESFRMATWGSLAIVPRNVGRYQVKANANAYRSFHTATPADELNTTDVGAGLALSRFGLVGDNRFAVQGRYAYRRTWLDGGNTVTMEDSIFPFMESHSVHLGPTFWDSKRNAYSAQYSASYQRFAELVRNGVKHSLALGQELNAVERLQIRLGESGFFVDTTEAYRRYGAGLGLTASYRICEKWSVAAGATGQYERYPDSALYFGVVRTDWMYVTRLELIWTLPKGFSAGLFGAASGRHATVEWLSYDKMEAGLTVSWNGEVEL